MNKLFKKPSSLQKFPKQSSSKLTKISDDKLLEKYRNKNESNLLFLFDATGSMQSVWNFTSSVLNELVNRLSEMGKFSSRWIAYRDYMDGDGLIESSAWISDVNLMKQFINNIDCFGGGGNDGEAVERALEEAVKDAKATRVILIGDEPPLSQSECVKSALKLKEMNVPIYSFAVKFGGSYDERTIMAFTEIASLSKGEFSKLQSVQDLLDIIAITVAEDIGGKVSIEEYLRKYDANKQLTSGGKEFGQKMLNK